MNGRCVSSSLDFFSEDEAVQAECVALCRTCPVQEACAEMAFEAETYDRYTFGVFGGLTAAERGSMTNKRTPTLEQMWQTKKK